MKSKLLFLLLVFTQILSAQTFTEMTGTPFVGVSSGSIAFSDVNDDGHQDVLITGLKDVSGFERIAKLYTNDGTGNFSEMTGTPFDAVWYSSIAFSDVNGDGHQDVLITGTNSSDEPIAKLYTNDGTGNFSEMTGTPFDGVWFGSIAFSDVNGDGHQDVLITGQNGSDELIAKLYTNDGTGNFSEMTGTPFDGVAASSIAFSDVNGDGHQDVLIAGVKDVSGYELITKLYTNDGTGNFTEMTGTPFDGVAASSIAFSDVNGDGHQDVLITGQNGPDELIAKLYTNDGTGNFSEMTGTPFDGVAASSIAFSDVNGDGHQDVLITGAKDGIGNELIAKLYTNDGTGNFSEMTGTPFDAVWYSSIAFSDVNGDGHLDVLITGENGSGEPIAKLYTNDGMVSSIVDLIIENCLDLTLFPNPSALERLYINYDAADYGEVLVRMYSMNGILLRQQKEYRSSGQQTLTIDISSLPKGNYFLELEDGKRREVGKFIVQ